jgi:chaperone required for assembly of F1-ATPase
LFLQPATALQQQQNDLYNPVASAYRNQLAAAAAAAAGTGLQAQPNTMMVSSATSTLMSSAVKPSSQHVYR